MHIKLIVSSLVLLAASSAFAAEPITGAFGIKFGESIDHLKIDRTLVNGVVHIVTPPKPLESLRLYSVETAKGRKQVFRITGQALTNNKIGCLGDLSSIMGILEQKYGKFKNLDTIFLLKQGDKSITASCTAEGGITDKRTYMIKITYEDLGLSGKSDAL
ncbi:MAG TPA: hypothetical protein EYP40_11885 [Chromatiales bacterium]|nr:hypothetical protein [Chromatiales bacterium]